MTKNQCKLYTHMHSMTTAILHKRCIHRLSAANLLIYFFSSCIIFVYMLFCRSHIIFFKSFLSVRITTETKKKQHDRYRQKRHRKKTVSYMILIIREFETINSLCLNCQCFISHSLQCEDSLKSKFGKSKIYVD